MKRIQTINRSIRLKDSRTEDPCYYEQVAYDTELELIQYLESDVVGSLDSDFERFGAVELIDDPNSCYFRYSTLGVYAGCGTSSRHKARPNPELSKRIRKHEVRCERLIKKQSLYCALASALAALQLEQPREAIKNFRTRGKIILNSREYEIQVVATEECNIPYWRIQWPYNLNISFYKNFDDVSK
jgi:hypothetical protein